MMDIIVTLIIFGVLLYIVGQVPMPQWVRNVINAVACIFVVLWLLQALGVATHHPILLR